MPCISIHHSQSPLRYIIFRNKDGLPIGMHLDWTGKVSFHCRLVSLVLFGFSSRRMASLSLSHSTIHVYHRHSLDFGGSASLIRMETRHGKLERPKVVFPGSSSRGSPQVQNPSISSTYNTNAWRWVVLCHPRTREVAYCRPGLWGLSQIRALLEHSRFLQGDITSRDQSH